MKDVMGEILMRTSKKIRTAGEKCIGLFAGTLTSVGN